MADGLDALLFMLQARVQPWPIEGLFEMAAFTEVRGGRGGGGVTMASAHPGSLVQWSQPAGLGTGVIMPWSSSLLLALRVYNLSS